MAGLHAGVFKDKYKCERCDENPSLKKAWGCHERTQMQVPTFAYQDGGVVYRYWNCPWRFVPKSLETFFAIYKYYKDFPSAPMPPIHEVSGRFLSAARHYDHEYAECLRNKEK